MMARDLADKRSSGLMSTVAMSMVAALLLGVVAAVVLSPSLSGAAETVNQTSGKKKKSTELSFDDVLVQGKYHFSDEAVTTVEDDKILDALLGVRTDFKDRIKKSTARQ